ncbi:MAG: hypothetical protein B5M48_01780 [Candidatus Omnitrophica bacterium 4484_213]|nr:MAG: hypothetical protein B5M48_01780 [Candidatus Omnitrophica bacterium 4484_213]
MLKKVTSSDINIFTQQLKSLIKSKVGLLPALNILYEETPKESMRDIIHDLYDAVAKGRMFSESLEQHPRLFSSLYVSIIKAGENAGHLEDALNQISVFISSQEELKMKVRVALAYPLFMFLMGVITILILFSFVIPRLGMIFSDFGGALPLPTKLLLGGGRLFSNLWFWLVVAIVGILSFRFIDLSRVKMRIPVWGKIIKQEAIARFSRSLSLLLNGGVSIFEALKIAAPSLDNYQMIEEIKQAREKVVAGSSLTNAMKDLHSFPPYFRRMISVGEKGSKLEGVLVELADNYERQVEIGLKMVTSLIEPVIILILGLVLGVIIIAMLLPIFQMNLLAR